MASKLNNKAVLAYAESFAKAVCSEFFASTDVISGSQLTNFCNIKQVNLFIIKILFEKWQGENAKIKSPFFDYDNPEVKTLLEKLMNTLSRHISIKQPDFEGLVTEAVADTIQLLLAPYVFYEQELKKLGDSIKVTETLKPALKYVKTHKVLHDQIMDGLESASQAGTISTTKAIEVVGEIVDNTVEYDDPRVVLRQLTEVVPIKVQEFVTFTDQTEEKKPEPIAKPIEQPKPEAKKEEQSNFFDALDDEPTNVRPSRPNIENPQAKEEPKTVVEDKKVEEKPLFTSYKPSETVHKKTEYTPSTFERNGVHKTEATATVSNAEERTFAEKIANKSEEPTFAERFKPSGKSIRELISLQQKFLFIKKLFGNNQQELEEALNYIDQCSSHKEAIMYLKDNYLLKYDWDFQSEEVKEFWELVELRF